MIVDFTVENFRSIKEAVTLSCVAQRGRSVRDENNQLYRPDDKIAKPYSLPIGIDILPLLTIYGANASGKSNVLTALDTLLRLMVLGTERAYEGIGSRKLEYMPFRLDEKNRQKPVTFEVRILAISEVLQSRNGIYTYRLSFDETHVYQESLEFLPITSSTSKTQVLFERVLTHAGVTWTNGADFNGPHIQLQSTLKAHQIYLPLLFRLGVIVIDPLIQWGISREIGVNLGMEDIEMKHMLSRCFKNSELREFVASFVRLFDTGIDNIEIEEHPEKIDRYGWSDYTAWCHHTNQVTGIEEKWALWNESLGTQRLLLFAGKLATAFKYGGVLLVDELGHNLHPYITHQIVRMFQDKNINKKDAQLIFTSHDLSLWKNNLLRRDQIWFTEMTTERSTRLFALSDFHVRKDLQLENAYLEGRFGAVPILPLKNIMKIILDAGDSISE